MLWEPIGFPLRLSARKNPGEKLRIFFREIDFFFRPILFPCECRLRIRNFIKIGPRISEQSVPNTPRTDKLRSLLLGYRESEYKLELLFVETYFC